MLYPVLFTLTGIWCAGALAAACTSDQRARRRADAREVFRLSLLRNGVTAEIPFVTPHHTLNAPGLVRVHPHSHRSLSTAPVPAACAMEPPPTGERKPVDEPVEPVDEAVDEPVEEKWGYPKGNHSADLITPEAKKAIQLLVDDGERRKTVISWAVFGSNGGAAYAAAKPYIEEALNAK